MMQLLLDFYLDVPNKSMVKHYQRFTADYSDIVSDKNYTTGG